MLPYLECRLAANRGAAQAVIIGAVADNNAAGAAGIREKLFPYRAAYRSAGAGHCYVDAINADD